MLSRLKATELHLPYALPQSVHLQPDTGERAPPPSQTGGYSICVPRKDERLS